MKSLSSNRWKKMGYKIKEVIDIMVWIELTDKQVKMLAEEEALVKQAFKAGKPGGILGQVYPNENVMRAQFLPEEVAIEIVNILKRYSIYRENLYDVSENPI